MFVSIKPKAHLGSFTLLLCVFSASVASAAPPATQQTATLLNGRIEYTPPPAWKLSESNLQADIAVAFVAEDHSGLLDLHILPENAAINADAAKQIVILLRGRHKKAGQALVEGPTIEQDKRFAIKIHERYKTSDGSVADEVHLFQRVGGRAIELDVQSVSPDATVAAAIHKVGEDMMLSVHWKKPAAKPKTK